MSKVRIFMKDAKKILRMFLVENRKVRNIATMTGIPYSTVYDYITLAKARTLTWPQVEAMSDDALEQVLFASKSDRPPPNWEYIEKELKRAGVTLQLLWMEYKEAHPEGYQYSRFCEIYESWCKKNEVYTPMPDKAGEELFVDYSGDKMPFICPETSVVMQAEIFVATLGASERIYVEASRCQQLPFWVESNCNAFEYNAGSTEMVIPDNLKSAVTTPDRYEASINLTYEEMGNHYNTFIVPARSVRPKDKALVEKSVQIVQREILAPLRNQTFFGIDGLNKGIRTRLEAVNNRPFQKLSGTREGRYEEIDKPALKPLPTNRYCYREWVTKLIVGQNHHIQVKGHNYSVPYQYARAEVEAAVDTKLVEIFCKGQIIARHQRSFVQDGRTILREHMPPKYQYYFDSYDPQLLLNKAKEIGPNVSLWAEVIFALKARPPKLLCNTVLGALSLTKEFEKNRVDAICARALILNVHSYKHLKSMLIKGADYLPLPPQGKFESHLPQDHANLRSADSFF